MKLYQVHLWDKDLKEERFPLIIANTEDEAEQKALDNDYLSCAEVSKEVTEFDGYRIAFEKISS